MTAFFESLQNLPPSRWLAESESLWAFATVLFLHSMGMALSAGSASVIGLRLVGVGRPLPVSSLRFLSKVFWTGVILNLATGSWMFASAASRLGVNPMYYAKLALIVSGVLTWIPIGQFLDGEASDSVIPSRVKLLGAMSLFIWLGVITTGRLVAYVQ